MKILVHICCGPCAIYPLKEVLDEKEELWGFFYNPNIHPYQEYLKRLNAVKTLSGVMELKMVYRDEYDLEGFLANVAHNVEQRCQYCYSSRLEATALEAKKRGFDAFTSSLLYSKYQGHELIRDMGEKIGTNYGVPFFYRDFRGGWKEGIKASKDMGLYRQQYCGCIYSEKERYQRR